MNNYLCRCYGFVLIISQFRFTVRYETDEIYLVYSRDLSNYKELSISDIAKENNYKTPKVYSNINTIKEAQKALKRANPYLLRGFIFIDANNRRISLSNPYYISITYGSDFSSLGGLNIIRDMDQKVMNELIKYNKKDLFLYYYPEWNDFAEEISEPHESFCLVVKKFFEKLNMESTTTLDFFTAADKYPQISTILRRMRQDHHVDPKEFCSLLIHRSKLYSVPFKSFLAEKSLLEEQYHKVINNN